MNEVYIHFVYEGNQINGIEFGLLRFATLGVRSKRDYEFMESENNYCDVVSRRSADLFIGLRSLKGIGSRRSGAQNSDPHIQLANASENFCTTYKDESCYDCATARTSTSAQEYCPHISERQLKFLHRSWRRGLLCLRQHSHIDFCAAAGVMYS